MHDSAIQLKQDLQHRIHHDHDDSRLPQRLNCQHVPSGCWTLQLICCLQLRDGSTHQGTVASMQENIGNLQVTLPRVCFLDTPRPLDLTPAQLAAPCIGPTHAHVVPSLKLHWLRLSTLTLHGCMHASSMRSPSLASTLTKRCFQAPHTRVYACTHPPTHPEEACE